MPGCGGAGAVRHSSARASEHVRRHVSRRDEQHGSHRSGSGGSLVPRRRLDAARRSPARVRRTGLVGFVRGRFPMGSYAVCVPYPAVAPASEAPDVDLRHRLRLLQIPAPPCGRGRARARNHVGREPSVDQARSAFRSASSSGSARYRGASEPVRLPGIPSMRCAIPSEAGSFAAT